MMGGTERRTQVVEDFLTLWKAATQDISIYQKAKANTQLRTGSIAHFELRGVGG